MKKNELLKSIIDEEAKEAQHGANASKLRQQYVELFCPFKQNDMVIYMRENEPESIGKIGMIYYHNGGFRYWVRPYTKNLEPMLRRNPIWIYSINKMHTIEKI